MIATGEWGSIWVVLWILLSVLTNGLFWFVLLGRQKSVGRSLETVKGQLEGRCLELEEALSAFQQDQEERLAGVRSHIARLELRGAIGSERLPKAPGVGLDKKHQVFSLARKGLATDEISKQLNLYPGETELLLGLRAYCSHPEKKNARSVLQ